MYVCEYAFKIAFNAEISNEGKVYRPKHADAHVILTARLEKDGMENMAAPNAAPPASFKKLRRDTVCSDDGVDIV